MTDFLTGTAPYVQLARSDGTIAGTAAKDIKTLYKATYLLNREPELVFQQFAQKQTDMDIPLNKGDNVEFTRYAPLTMETDYFLLAEGTPPTNPEQYFAQTVTAKLDEYGNYVKPSSRLWLTAFDPKLGGLAKLLGIQSGKSLDLKIQSVLAAGFIGMRADGDTTYSKEVTLTTGSSVTTAVLSAAVTPTVGVIVFTSGRCEGISRTFTGTGGATLTVPTMPQTPQSGDTARICDTTGLGAGDKITAELIKKAVAILESQETPLFPDGYYHGVIPAGAMKYDFMNDTEYINLKHYAAPKDLYRNLVGEFDNVRFHKTTSPHRHTAADIPTYVAAGAIQMVTIFGSDAFGNIKLAGKDQAFEVLPPDFTLATPMASFGIMTWKNMYCPLVLNGAWGVNIFAVPTLL